VADRPIRVLIADDHPVVRQGLRTYLELQPDIEVAGAHQPPRKYEKIQGYDDGR